MCTGIRIQATNGDYVYARTMEFDTPLPTNLGYAPRGTKYTGLTTTGADGISWEHKYAVGGQTGPRGCSDAMNEKGVVAGGFNLPGYTEFTAVTDENRSKALAIEQAQPASSATTRVPPRRRTGSWLGTSSLPILRSRLLVPLLVNCHCTFALVIPLEPPW